MKLFYYLPKSGSICKRVLQDSVENSLEKHDKMYYKISSTKKIFFLWVSFVHHGLVLASCDQEDVYLNLVKMTYSSLKSFYCIDFFGGKVNKILWRTAVYFLIVCIIIMASLSTCNY